MMATMTFENNGTFQKDVRPLVNKTQYFDNAARKLCFVATVDICFEI